MHIKAEISHFTNLFGNRCKIKTTVNFYWYRGDYLIDYPLGSPKNLKKEAIKTIINKIHRHDITSGKITRDMLKVSPDAYPLYDFTELEGRWSTD